MLRYRVAAHWLAWAILAAHALIAVASQRHESVTFNEFAHLAAGVAYWKEGAFELYNVNPPLSKLMAALPVMALSPETPEPSYWRAQRGTRAEWEYGLEFLRRNRTRYRLLFSVGRLSIIALSVLGGWCVWRWSSELHGAGGGLVSVTLWAFCPNILAAAQFVTPDGATASLIVLACYSYWRWLKHPTIATAVWAGAFLGLAELCKFTALLLYPSWCLILVANLCSTRSANLNPAVTLADKPSFGARIRAGAAQLLIAFSVSALVINFGYGFRQMGRSLGELPFRSEALASEQPSRVSTRVDDDGRSVFRYEVVRGSRFAQTPFANLPVPFPEQYLLGIDGQRRDFENPPLPGYLRGVLSKKGWWYFYFYAFFVKVPIGTMCIVVLAGLVVCVSRNFRTGWVDEVAVVCFPVALVFVASVERSVAQSMRYVVPALPFLFVTMGRVGRAFVGNAVGRLGVVRGQRRPVASRRVFGAIVVASLAGNIVSVLSVYPNFLGYFNEIAGGPKSGAKHLLFSNLDWGQDLFSLKAWIADHPDAKPLGLAYFHFIDPEIEGIEYQLPPTVPAPGWYAVSANFVHGMGFSVWDGEARRREVKEGTYRYFQQLDPVDTAGWSIYIYHITDKDISRLRDYAEVDR